mgnify:CR=1 FL=1
MALEITFFGGRDNMESELVPGEKELLKQLAVLLQSDASRYHSQAIDLLRNERLEITCNSVVISYQVKNGSFIYKYRSHSDNSFQESEELAPEKLEDQIQSLIFMFALSEAEVLV